MTGTRAAETADRKRRILAAATALAAEGGYDAVQMRDVAARAEVALGTLYRHYTSKDQLLLSAMLEQTTTLRERLINRPAQGATPASRVADVLRRASRALERQPQVTRAMLTAMSSADDGTTEIKHQVDDTLRAIIADTVDDIVRVLGSVWFAELTAWSNGLANGRSIADSLGRAAELLLR